MPHQPGQPERHQLLRGRAGIWETGTARTFLQGSGYFMQKPRDFTLPAQGGPRGPSAVVSQHCRVNSGSTKISTGSLKTGPAPRHFCKNDPGNSQGREASRKACKGLSRSTRNSLPEKIHFPPLISTQRPLSYSSQPRLWYP